jgi:O-antigen/teichoic acid export membrane protein
VSLVSCEVVSAKYQLEQRYAPFSIIGAVTPLYRLLVALLVVFSVFQGDALFLTATGYMVSSLIVIALLFPQLRSLWHLRLELKGHGPEPSEKPAIQDSITALLSKVWVFGVAGLLYLAWAQGHVVIAQFALSSHDAGSYNAALVMLNAISLLPTVAFSKFLLPKIHRWAAQDFEKLKHFGRLSSVIMLGVGLVTAVALYFAAPLFIRLAFGPGYETAATVLQVLSFTIPIRFLAYSAGAMLRTQRLMQVKVVLLSTAVIFNLILIYFFIPHWGILGLAATVPITEFLLFSTYVYIMEFHYFRGRTEGPFQSN